MYGLYPWMWKSEVAVATLWITSYNGTHSLGMADGWVADAKAVERSKYIYFPRETTT